MELPAFDLRLLVAFSAVAEELHFGRAAAQLGMAQPKLSQQIARLERQLGTALLKRYGGGVALTPSGARVLAEGRAALARATLVESQLRRERTALRVHLGDAVHPLVRAVAESFTAAHPTTDVRFSRGSNSEGVRALADGRADVAFDQPEGTPPGMSVAVLDGRPLGVTCAPGHRLAGRSTAEWADLEGESVIDPQPGVSDAFGLTIRAELRRAGLSAVTLVVPRTNSPLCLGPSLAGAEAVMICTEEYSRRVPARLQWRPLLPERQVEIAVIWDGRVASTPVRRFVEHAVASVPVRPIGPTEEVTAA